MTYKAGASDGNNGQVSFFVLFYTLMFKQVEFGFLAVCGLVVITFLTLGGTAFAQAVNPNFTFATSASSTLASSSDAAATSTTPSLEPESGIFGVLTTVPKQDLTKPEEQPQKNEIQVLLEKRPVKEFSLLNIFAYWVQSAIDLGIPANTIVLILLIPVVATLITFVRVIIGLPALEMLVPIILSFAFVAVGITAGLIILTAVILASFLSRTVLKRVPIMFFPKRSLSLLFLSFFVFGALTLSIMLDMESIRNLSIFPVLILTLLGDSIVTVQLRKALSETVIITAVTIALALIGYALATSLWVRDLIILWPEYILLTIPVNLLLGRYFGLRLTELFKFRNLQSYGGK